jgi:hypothetical protein
MHGMAYLLSFLELAIDHRTAFSIILMGNRIADYSLDRAKPV